MAYLRNTTINRLNLHYGIHTFALEGGGVFFRVFLLKAGLSVPLVLVTVALILAGRFVLRPLVLVAAKRFGVKAVVIFGTVVTGLQYPFLPFVHGVDLMLAGFILIASIGDTFYWTSYHAYFATLGDAEHRGHQIGAREALAAVVGIVAPVVGGWTLATLGPVVAFNATAGVQFVAALPLLRAPAIAIAPSAPGAFKAAWRGVLLFVCDGWIAAGYYFVWQMVLFFSLSQSFTAFGGAMAIAALAGAISGMALGRLIDAGHGVRAVWLAFGVLLLTTVVRAASSGATMAVIANALGALVLCLYVPTVMTAVYNEAKKSPCALRFHVATEGAWDVGCAASCFVAAGLVALGASLSVAILLSLIGAAASLVLLLRYYKGLSGAIPLAPIDLAPADTRN
ncbi:MAG: MFS transporter [Alphaproteobacteria bacterium]|nr:MFS transporter [Alphaproteobacteria bacterium]